MTDFVLFIDELRSSSSICRICHEQQFESCKNLESPCACSGTVKFAHRDCIQRWCNEKGNTICELCLQKFEPGYTAPPRKKLTELINTTVTRRETPRTDTEQENSEEIVETQYSENESAADTDSSSVSRCRLVALIFTALLLMRHLLAVVNGEPEAYPFSLITILIAKACGVIVPMYILIWIIDTIHNNFRRHYRNLNTDSSSDDVDEDEERPSGVHMHP